MKTSKSRKAILLLCLASGLLASCHLLGDPIKAIVAPPDVPLDNAAKDWMHEQNGQQLQFQNAGGQTQSVRVRRLEGDSKSGVLSGKVPIPHVPVKTEFIELDYYFSLSPQKDSLSLVVADKNLLYVFNTVLPNYEAYNARQLLASFYTCFPTGCERVASPSTLETTYTLGTHTYESLLRVPHVATSKSPTPNATEVEEIFYSRADGLVGYKTVGGQLWLRQ